MRRFFAIAATFAAALAVAGPAAAATSSNIAALQVALRAHGHYAAPVDGVKGPLTLSALETFQGHLGVKASGRIEKTTRSALGPLGRPMLGKRELAIGAIGWDVSVLEFKLVAFGLPLKAVDGKFTAATAKALVRFQGERGLAADGIAGPQTYRALASVKGGAPRTPALKTYVVRDGDSFSTIALQYGVDPLLLARQNGLGLDAVIVPGQRLTLPSGAKQAPVVARPSGPAGTPAATKDVLASLDQWSATYEVDPQLARAVAWMESGLRQEVVSSAGAVGVMQLLPSTWAWVDESLLGTATPRTYDGNIQAGVRYLRWLLDQFGGDRRLALAGYYQGPQAVRDRGLFEDTKRYVAAVLSLIGTV